MDKQQNYWTSSTEARRKKVDPIGRIFEKQRKVVCDLI